MYITPEEVIYLNYGLKQLQALPDNIHCFSGGTEITVFDLRAVSAIKRAGFNVIKSENTKNPKYFIHHLSKKASEHYSKIFNEEPNPQKFYSDYDVWRSR